MNKIFAFGGDYERSVEKMVGYLHMAKEALGFVFGRRIDHGLMSFDQVMIDILQQWFWDNVFNLYIRLPMDQLPQIQLSSVTDNCSGHTPLLYESPATSGFSLSIVWDLLHVHSLPFYQDDWGHQN